MKIVSFATSNHVGLENLKLSISKVNGWEHIIIGQGIKWKGWITRMQHYRDYCESLGDEIIVFSDAYDVLCLRGSDHFLELYNQYAKDKIIIGAELGCHPGNCFPPEEWYNENDLDKNSVARRFVNGGLIAGPANKIFNMWKWAIENKFDDDQIALGNYTNSYPHLIFLDIESIFFFNDQNAVSKYEFDEKDNSIVEDLKIKTPFFIHFHGLNINTSIPITTKKKDLFEVGKNYKKIGLHVNGAEHINGFPPDTRSSQLGIWVERSAYFLIFFIFLALLIILISHKK